MKLHSTPRILLFCAAALLLAGPLGAVAMVGPDTYAGLAKISRPAVFRITADSETLSALGAQAGFREGLGRAIGAKLAAAKVAITKTGALSDGTPLFSLLLWARTVGSPGHRFIAYQYSLLAAASIQDLTGAASDKGAVILWQQDNAGVTDDSPAAADAQVVKILQTTDQFIKDLQAARASKLGV
jgi:hypothetical protein